MKVLGLCGYAGSGKDHVFRWLNDNTTMRVTRLALADQVRYEVADLFGLDAHAEVLWKKPYPEGLRWILQHYGTEYRRAADPDYWVKKAHQALLDLYLEDEPGTHLVVITDVRFGNEADLVRYWGGLTALVDAPDMVRRERLGGQLPPKHASEVVDFDYDITIDNGTRGREPIFPADFWGWLGEE